MSVAAGWGATTNLVDHRRSRPDKRRFQGFVEQISNPATASPVTAMRPCDPWSEACPLTEIDENRASPAPC